MNHLLQSITNGTVLAMAKGQDVLHYVCIHMDNVDLTKYAGPFSRKQSTNNTPYILFAGMWYDGNPLTGKPYGKTHGQLKVGMLNCATIVGHVSDGEEIQRLLR